MEAKKVPDASALSFASHAFALSRRLIWVAVTFLVAAAVAYPFVGSILAMLAAPSGEQQLFYLTSAGELGFIAKVCSFAGLAAAMPVLTYQVLRYLESISKGARKPIVLYASLSLLLTAGGVAFAYFVSLAPALHILTDFGVQNVTATFTADSYVSFTAAYALGTVALFQVPLLLVATNSFRRLSQGKLLSLLGYVTVTAFAVSAILTPTPDPINLVLFATPTILMYMAGAGVVLFVNDRKNETSEPHPVYVYKPDATPASNPVVAKEKPAPVPVAEPAQIAKPASSVTIAPKPAPKYRPAPVRQMDFVTRPAVTRPEPTRVQPTLQAERPIPVAPQPMQRVYRSRPAVTTVSRSIDGLLPQRT